MVHIFLLMKKTSMEFKDIDFCCTASSEQIEL